MELTYKTKLERIRELLREIVVTEGEDRGVVLLTDDAPTTYDERLGTHVFELEHFSPLGEALIKVWEEAQVSTPSETPGSPAGGSAEGA